MALLLAIGFVGRRFIVTVGVVHVGRVRMRVVDPAVPMKMAVRLAGRFAAGVGVTMMFVVHVRMRMRHRLVNVPVFVALGEVQPHAQPHEATRRYQSERHGFRERDDRRQ